MDRGLWPVGGGQVWELGADCSVGVPCASAPLSTPQCPAARHATRRHSTRPGRHAMAGYRPRVKGPGGTGSSSGHRYPSHPRSLQLQRQRSHCHSRRRPNDTSSPPPHTSLKSDLPVRSRGVGESRSGSHRVPPAFWTFALRCGSQSHERWKTGRGGGAGEGARGPDGGGSRAGLCRVRSVRCQWQCADCRSDEGLMNPNPTRLPRITASTPTHFARPFDRRFVTGSMHRRDRPDASSQKRSFSSGPVSLQERGPGAARVSEARDRHACRRLSRRRAGPPQPDCTASPAARSLHSALWSRLC